MPAKKDTPAIITRVKQLLAEAEPSGVSLVLNSWRYDDEWLYLNVSPTREGERASQHAHMMINIERTLRGEGYNQVLLVPNVPEHEG